MISPDRSRRGRQWRTFRHPLFWKMFAADLLLVGITATLFPGRSGVGLAILVIVLALASLGVNMILTPPDRDR